LERYFVHLDEYGVAHRVDLDTGESVPVEATLVTQDDTEKNRLEVHEAKHLAHGKAWMPRNTAAADVEAVTKAKYRPTLYSSFVVDIMLDRIMNGDSITSICKEKGFPTYNSFCRWKRESPGFAENIRRAKRDRSEVYFDKIIKSMDDMDDVANKDEVASRKLKVDSYKYIAKIGNQDEFGDKSQIKAEVASTHFIIETGIRRVNDPGYMPDETKKLVEEEVIELKAANDQG
jgi:hypothetical protein